MLGLDVYSAVKAIGEADFEYIELWGEVPHAHPDWVDRGKLRDSLSPYSMEVTVHAPFTDLNPASPFQPVKAAVEKTLGSFVDFGVSLGARIITVHPGSVHNEAMMPQSAPSAASTLKGMVRVADGRVGINVENQTKGRSKYHFPLGTTPESLEAIASGVDGLGFTLDTGHAYANGDDPLDFARWAGPRLTEVHLHDNGGASDEHLIPGEGSSNLQGLLESVDRPDLLVCLELDPYRYSPEAVVKGSRAFKERIGVHPFGAVKLRIE